MKTWWLIISMIVYAAPAFSLDLAQQFAISYSTYCASYEEIIDHEHHHRTREIVGASRRLLNAVSRMNHIIDTSAKSARASCASINETIDRLSTVRDSTVEADFIINQILLAIMERTVATYSTIRLLHEELFRAKGDSIAYHCQHLPNVRRPIIDLEQKTRNCLVCTAHQSRAIIHEVKVLNFAITKRLITELPEFRESFILSKAQLQSVLTLLTKTIENSP